MRKLLIGLGLAGWLGIQHGAAQNELSNFTATGRGGVTQTFVNDYQSIGINPANLGRSNPAVASFTFLETGVGINSQSLTRGQLRKFIFSLDDSLSQADKQLFSKAFTHPDAFNLNADITTFALAVQIPRIGGFAFNNRHRITTHFGLNRNGAEILFMGKDAPIYQTPVYQNYDPNNPEGLPLLSDLLGGTTLQGSWVNEYNIAYGRQVTDQEDFKLYAGAGYKYLEGVAVIDIVVRKDDVRAYTAVSPIFDVDYGKVLQDPKFNYKTSGKGWTKPVGTGQGFDLGVSAEVKKKYRFGLAVTDLGRMTWRGNLLTAEDQVVQKVVSNGISTFNLFKEVPNFVGSGKDSLVKYKPEQKRSVSLPARIRTGMGWTVSEKLEAGLDVTVPLNTVAGNLPNPFVGLGVDYKPVPLVRLSSGISAGAGYSWSLPAGVTLVSRIYEMGIGTRDLIGLFSEKNPYFSLAFGFLRFKIPGKAPEGA